MFHGIATEHSCTNAKRRHLSTELSTGEIHLFYIGCTIGLVIYTMLTSCYDVYFGEHQAVSAARLITFCWITIRYILNYLLQDVRAKCKQNWINHLERMDNTRLPNHALNYKPRERRDRGRHRKRWQRADAGTGQAT